MNVQEFLEISSKQMFAELYERLPPDKSWKHFPSFHAINLRSQNMKIRQWQKYRKCLQTIKDSKYCCAVSEMKFQCRIQLTRTRFVLISFPSLMTLWPLRVIFITASTEIKRNIKSFVIEFVGSHQSNWWIHRQNENLSSFPSNIWTDFSHESSLFKVPPNIIRHRNSVQEFSARCSTEFSPSHLPTFLFWQPANFPRQEFSPESFHD